jgi:hypothetical protein
MRGREERIIRWIKVANIGPAKVTVGLSRDGYWVRGDGATVEVANGPHAITLLPCLEIPIEDIRNSIRNGLVDLSLPLHLEDTFPLTDLVVAALASGSELWTRLALDRIEEGFCNERVNNALGEASVYAPTQHLRHRAKALVDRPNPPLE